ncbi:MAG: hypothetical protein QM778_01365 [Myxococcales bacterium]
MKARLLITTSLLMAACGDSRGDQPGPLGDAGPDGSVHMDAAAGSDAGDAADAAAQDAAADAGSELCTALPVPADCPPLTGNALPQELRCTGLYADSQSRRLACGVTEYAPAFALWSDGADKHRYLWLPPGTKIDVSSPDGFVFPEGTRLWKEFRVVDGDHTRLGETRLLMKRAGVWSATTYVWSEDETTAVQNNDGVANLYGTGHTVPTRDQCSQCHSGRPDFALGFDPIMLGPGASGLSMQTLFDRGLLIDANSADGLPAASLLSAKPPGDAVESAALGYLHANCGVSCHNQEAFAEAKQSGLNLRLEQGEYGSVFDTDAVKTSLNQGYGNNAVLPSPVPAGGYLRVRPTDPTRSLLLGRMAVRGPAQMPRIATNQVDDKGVTAVRLWIEQMTEARGYPAPNP